MRYEVKGGSGVLLRFWMCCLPLQGCWEYFTQDFDIAIMGHTYLLPVWLGSQITLRLTG